MSNKDRAAEALRLAEQLDSLVIIDEVGSNNPLAKESAAMLREYATLLQAQPAEAKHIQRLEAENEALKKDAERWRTFLKTRPAATHDVINQAIDDAMTKEQKT